MAIGERWREFCRILAGYEWRNDSCTGALLGHGSLRGTGDNLPIDRRTACTVADLGNNTPTSLDELQERLTRALDAKTFEPDAEHAEVVCTYGHRVKDFPPELGVSSADDIHRGNGRLYFPGAMKKGLNKGRLGEHRRR